MGAHEIIQQDQNRQNIQEAELNFQAAGEAMSHGKLILGDSKQSAVNHHRSVQQPMPNTRFQTSKLIFCHI